MIVVIVVGVVVVVVVDRIMALIMAFGVVGQRQ